MAIPQAITLRTADDIKRGYPWPKARAVQQRYELTDKLFAKLLGVSDRTLSRAKRAKGGLDAVASDRLYRLARLLDFAVEVFEDKDGALGWLRREQPGLGGRVPLELLDTEPGARAVETLLGRIEHAVLA